MKLTYKIMRTPAHDLSGSGEDMSTSRIAVDSANPDSGIPAPAMTTDWHIGAAREKFLRAAQQISLGRRAFLTGAISLLAMPALTGAARAAGAQSFISPKGKGDGSSWEQAAPISALNNLIKRVGPGGRVYIRADAGEYRVRNAITIAAKGTQSAPVIISGVTKGLKAKKAKFVGSRKNWTRARSSSGRKNVKGFGGNTLFHVKRGASHLQIGNFAVVNFGKIFDFSDISASNFTLHDIDFHNIRNGIYATGKSKISNVAILRLNGAGFSKKCIRFRGGSRNWLIENCNLDSGWQYGDAFAIGIEAADSARGLQIVGGSTKNCLDTKKGNQEKYWNGDGVATERNNKDIKITNHTSSGHSDGSYDLKSESTILTNCVAEGSKRNFRIWGGVGSNPIVIKNCKSISPRSHGGIGGAHHIWASGSSSNSRKAASILFTGGSMSGGAKGSAAIYADGGNVAVHLVNANLSRLTKSMKKFSSTKESSKLIVGALEDNGASEILTGATQVAIAGVRTPIELSADGEASWRLVGDAENPMVELDGNRLLIDSDKVGALAPIILQARDSRGEAIQKEISLSVIANPVAPGTVLAVNFSGEEGSTSVFDETKINQVVLEGTAALAGTSLRFEGDKNFVHIKDSDFFAFEGPFTIDTTFMLDKTTAIKRLQSVLSQWKTKSNQRSFVLGVGDEGQVQFHWSPDGKNSDMKSLEGPILDPEIFYAVRVDRDEMGTMRLYLDGEMVAKLEGAAQPFANVDAHLRVSGNHDGSFATRGNIHSLLINNKRALAGNDSGYALS